MKKSTLFTLVVTAIPIVLLLFFFWIGGMFKLILQVFGPIGIVGVFAFIAFILAVIFIAMKLARNAIKPKTLANGLPATATVIRSYQGNMKISFGGVQQNYQLVIEVNVTNPQGETWSAKMTEMVPLTQIGIFQPGVSFKVLYDANDRSKVVFDQSEQPQQQSPTNSVNIPGYGTVNSQMAKAARQTAPQDITMQLQAASTLLNEFNANGYGVSASATVISSYSFYVNYMNGNDVYKIKLKVNATETAPFETEIITLIAKPSIYKIEPGKTVYVKYDRSNPQRVCLSGLDKPDSAIAL